MGCVFSETEYCVMGCVFRMSSELCELCVQSESNTVLTVSVSESRLEVLSLSTNPCQRHLGCVRNEFLGDQLRWWQLEFEWLLPRTQRFEISETKVWFKYPRVYPRLEICMEAP